MDFLDFSLDSILRLGKKNLGAPPGIENAADIDKPPEHGVVSICTIDYSLEGIEQQTHTDVEALLKSEKPDWATYRWIDIQGIHPYTVNRLKNHFNIHTLSAEDALNIPQRQKVEDYEGTLFIILRMLQITEGSLINEQVSFFYLGDVIITQQEKPGDVWEPVRERINREGSRLRQYGTPYLLYALIDAIIDNIFPILDTYFDLIDALEQEILLEPIKGTQMRIHNIKRDLAYLRQALWPMRDITSELYKNDIELLPKKVIPYYRDVHDHSLQAIEAVEMYLENAKGLQDLLMNANSNRMNEVMKALTIMASLFMPITFFAGLYGMNFEHIPELGWKYSYPIFLSVCALTTGFLLFYFKRKGWIGK
ncbi:MAG: magnesium/cobalt transporter CorA [Verrucomicrobia bacterium]|nr:magnesium/cobalt transporter CorA [Verrucomicrobiota bacterium]